jgi:hypothetical protein
MNKSFYTFLFSVVLSLTLSAQNNFEKGYVINSNGEKIEGLIKNLDWKDSPSQITFKQENNLSVKTYTIDNIKSFEIEGKVKYVKAEVNVDMSSDDINALTEDEKPHFTKKAVLLKTVIEGKYTLYKYASEYLERFFYQKENEIEPLIFKRYQISSSQVGKNNTYQNQLKTLSECGNITPSQFSNLEYRESSLKTVFIKLNTCGNEDYKSFDEKRANKKVFHLSVRPGINFSSLDIKNNSLNNVFDSDYGSKTNFRMGIEAEFVLPFNNSKWSIIAEPTYQYFKADKEVITSTILGEKVSNKSSVKYSSIEIPVGVRYYAFLNEKSKLFFNASAIFDIPMGDSEVTYEIYNYAQEKYKIESGINLGLGIGYKYNDKYSIEFNVHTKRDLLKLDQQDTSYQNFSIILGYTLF